MSRAQAPTFGDAVVEQGHELANRAPVEPAILPEQGIRAISDDRVGGGKEHCTLVAGELEIQPLPDASCVRSREPKPPQSEREPGALEITNPEAPSSRGRETRRQFTWQ